MRIACWITKATDTYSEYVILIAFPQQPWLRERTSMLSFYVQCLSCYRQQAMPVVRHTPVCEGVLGAFTELL